MFPNRKDPQTIHRILLLYIRGKMPTHQSTIILNLTKLGDRTITHLQLHNLAPLGPHYNPLPILSQHNTPHPSIIHKQPHLLSNIETHNSFQSRNVTDHQ
jgi:hypothetical protein